MIDITGRKRAEELLEREKSGFSTIIESLPCGVVFVDKDGNVIHQNVAMTDMLGYTVEDNPTIRESLPKYFPDPAYRKKIQNIWMADNQKHVEVRTFTVTCKEGSLKEIEFRPTCLEDGGKFMAVLDVTERWKAAEQIKASAAKYRELADSLPEVVFELDEKGIVTYGNNNGQGDGFAEAKVG